MQVNVIQFKTAAAKKQNINSQTNKLKSRSDEVQVCPMNPMMPSDFVPLGITPHSWQNVCQPPHKWRKGRDRGNVERKGSWFSLGHLILSLWAGIWALGGGVLTLPDEAWVVGPLLNCWIERGTGSPVQTISTRFPQKKSDGAQGRPKMTNISFKDFFFK